MKLLIVIPNYRVAHLTIDCLHSIVQEIGRMPGTHVAVCENGSGDGSAERIWNAIIHYGWDSWCSLTVLDIKSGIHGWQ
jgi:N-acetylglucosaminyl-diphospho-decaprenol L-rhamnosyltransferase